MASPDLSELHDEVSIHEQSSPESLRARAPSPLIHAHDHQLSTSEEHALDVSIEGDISFHKLKQYSSNRSSISSLPASIIHNSILSEYEDGGHHTPSKLFERSESPTSRLNIPGYTHGFRNPSSVRALQLGESEYTDTDVQSIARGYRHRKVPKMSYFGPRSPGSTQSSPTKRSSRPNTPQHLRNSSKLKKEFPLVLLHCTILAPTVATRLPQVSDELYEAVLPEEYKKRWRTLQDKVAKNAEVRQRGVLVAHPHEDYDLLEERLLESLELQRPRIRQHHFLASKSVDGIDSGFESSSQTDDGSDLELESKDKCPDCGTVVSSQIEQEREWQIKVYAANGLMKAGAWAAAWQEMEKVDIEVGVWMPEDIRTEVDERLTLLQAQQEAEKPVVEPPSPLQQSHRHRTKSARAKSRHEERMKEIYGESNRSAELENPTDHHASVDPVNPIFSEDHPVSTSSHDTADRRPHVTFAPDPIRHSHQHKSNTTISYIRRWSYNLLHDQKSLAILLLSLMVLFFAIQNATINKKSSHLATAPSHNVQQNEPDTQILQPVEIEPTVSYMTTTVFAPIPATTELEIEINTAAVETETELGKEEQIIEEYGLEIEGETTDNINELVSPAVLAEGVTPEDDLTISSVLQSEDTETGAETKQQQAAHLIEQGSDQDFELSDELHVELPM